MKLEDKMCVSGKLTIFRKEADGKLTKVLEKNNLVVNTGLQFLVNLMNGSSGLSHIAVGTDNTAVQAGDTTLGNELAREAFSSTAAVSTTWRADATFGSTEAVGTWEEAGMFNAAASGTMFNRVTGIGFTKSSGDTIIARFEITFSAV